MYGVDVYIGPCNRQICQ